MEQINNRIVSIDKVNKQINEKVCVLNRLYEREVNDNQEDFVIYQTPSSLVDYDCDGNSYLTIEGGDLDCHVDRNWVVFAIDSVYYILDRAVLIALPRQNNSVSIGLNIMIRMCIGNILPNLIQIEDTYESYISSDDHVEPMISNHVNTTTKKCNICGVAYPLETFHESCRKKRKNGEVKMYISTRQTCNKCRWLNRKQKKAKTV